MNRPIGSVGLQLPLARHLMGGPTTASIALHAAPVAGTYGFIASCCAASTKAGRMEDAWKLGLALRISARAFSVSPLTRPKMGVKRPGSRVDPSPET